MRSQSRAIRAVAAGLGFLVLALYALQAREAKNSADRRIGISRDTSELGILVESTVPDLPAAQAGLLPGDVIVQIGDTPTRVLVDYDVAAAHFRRGAPVRFEVLRDGRRQAVEVTPGTAYPWYDLLVNGLGAAGYLLIAILGLYTTGRGQDRRGYLLAAFSAAVAVELAMPSGLIGAPRLSLYVAGAYLLLTGLQMGLDLHLASIIPQRPAWLARRRWVVPAYYVLGGGIGIVVFASFIAGQFDRQPFPWTADQAQDWLQAWVLPLWAISVPALLLGAATRFPQPEGRHQAALVLTGVLPWSAYILITSAMGWRGIPVPDWLSGLQSLILLAYPAAIFVAIFRYHLFDLELVVRRSLLVAALTGTLVGLFYLSLWAAGAFFAQWAESGHASVWIVSGVMLLLGLLFAPLRRALQTQLDRRFFPERLVTRQRLIALASELPALGNVPLMGQHLVSQLSDIFGVRHATLLLTESKNRVLMSVAATRDETPGQLSILLGPEEHGTALLLNARHPLSARLAAARAPELAGRLQAAAAELVVPLVSQDRLVGALLLGKKQAALRPDFTAEELELLELVAHHAAIVFDNARLFESATYESLTGLLRREAVLERLEKEIQRAGRHHRPVTIGMADLDHFKEVNDQHGHLTGDRLLKRVAQAITSGLRSTDLVGRYGGEEFLIVLPETDMDGAMAVAEKVRELVANARVPGENGGEAGVTLSLGLAQLGAGADDGPRSARELIAAADRALYRAKHAGRNRVASPLVAG